jgi:hypothetical protein
MNRHHQPRPVVQAAARGRPLARWCALGLASALLHLFAIQWAGGHVDGLTPSAPEEPAVIRAGLITPFVAAAPAVQKPSPPPRPRSRQRKPTPAPSPQPSAMPVPAAEDAQATAFDPRLGEDASVPLGEMPVADAMPNPPVTADPVDPASPEPQRPHYAVAPPPSAVLKYDVRKVPREGNSTYGSGTITWRTDGTRYTIDGEAGVLFITALTFRSEGDLDASGVAPERYSEKRWRKPETNTHFHRERNTISFSASTLSYPRQGGEQDRASIIWQLAAIGRGDSAAFAPDAEIDVFVAGNRDGEVWKIRVIGQEEIKAAGHAVRAWHVRRTPRSGSYDQGLDIWLAPQHEWYPVKLRYTERNGDYLDMTVSDMAPATAS